jgi:hypothetical protein
MHHKTQSVCAQLDCEMKEIIVEDPKTLIEWAKQYFEENKEVLKLFGINDVDELQNRILEIVNQHPNKK